MKELLPSIIIFCIPNSTWSAISYLPNIVILLFYVHCQICSPVYPPKLSYWELEYFSFTQPFALLGLQTVIDLETNISDSIQLHWLLWTIYTHKPLLVYNKKPWRHLTLMPQPNFHSETTTYNPIHPDTYSIVFVGFFLIPAKIFSLLLSSTAVPIWQHSLLCHMPFLGSIILKINPSRLLQFLI